MTGAQAGVSGRRWTAHRSTNFSGMKKVADGRRADAMADASAVYETNNLRLPDLKRLTIGSAAPPAMIEAFERMGIPASQGWGMTEMSPIGSIGALKPPFEDLTGKDKIDRLSSRGFPPFLVEMKMHGRCWQQPAAGWQDIWATEGP